MDVAVRHIIQHLMWGWTNKRKVFVTANRYLGVGPNDMHETDVVAVLDGCRMPVVLRKMDKGYFFLGLCFVLGLMDGEAATMVQDGNAVTENFEIL